MLRFIKRKLFGIKSIGSIQIEATAKAQRSVDDQIAVSIKQAKIAKRALKRQTYADEEAGKGKNYIRNFNALFDAPKSDGDDTEEHS